MHYRKLMMAGALALAIGLMPGTARAQSGDDAQVMAVVQRLFDGMRAGDSAMVRSVFHPQVILTTAIVRQGTPEVRVDDVEGFIKAVGTPHAEVWDERIYNPQVDIDGTLAAVWVEYSFFAGSKFSHCGVDAFQLARDGAEWKIVALADTRRRTGCREQ